MKTKNKLFFDIETAGFNGQTNPILSVSWSKNTEEIKSLYANLASGASISRWAENKVWEPIKKQPVLFKEQQVLMSFLKVLEGAPTNTQLIGWNIGYIPSVQGKTQAGGFDISMLVTRAKQFGLEEKYKKAIKRMKIMDLGTTYAYRIAKAVVNPAIGNELLQQGILHPSLYKEAVAYTKQASKVAMEYGLSNESDIVRALSTSNIKFSGWKQEMVYELLFNKNLSMAHQSSVDVAALKKIENINKAIDKDFIQKWSKSALINKLISRAKYAPKDISQALPSRYEEIIKEAKQWKVFEEVESGLKKIATESGIDFSVIQSGKGIAEESRIIKENIFDKILQRESPNAFLSIIKKHPGKLAIGAGLAGFFLLQPGQYFENEEKKINLSNIFDVGTINPLKLSYSKSKEELEKTSSSTKFSFLKKALEEYGKETGTGHKRILIPKTFLSEKELKKELGFIPVNVAIPESGQDILQSFRHPYSTYHLHSHNKSWTLHRDEYSASTMMAKRWDIEHRKQKVGIFQEQFEKTKLFFKGLPHVLTEGIPGLFYYTSGKIFRKEDMAQRLEQELPQSYMNYMYGQTFSAKDDSYNSIEGLRHGGLAERIRKTLTDFGSGYLGKLALELPEALQKVMTGRIGFHGSKEAVIRTVSQAVKSEDKVATSALKNFVKDINKIKGDDLIVLNRQAAKEFAAKHGLKPENVMAGTALHESVHMGVKRAGLEGELEHLINKVSPSWRKQYEAERMAKNLPAVDESKLVEEFMAHGVGYRRMMGKKMPSEWKQATNLYEEELLPTFKISGFDDAHNTIMGLQEGGFAQKMRRFLTDFGSGYQGLFNLPKALKGMLGTTALTGTREELGKTIAKNIMASSEKGLSGGILTKTLTNWKVAKQKKAFGRLLEQFKTSPYKKHVLLDPNAIKKEAKGLGISASERTEMLSRHERFHQLIGEYNVDIGTKIDIPQQFEKPFIDWRQKAGFHQLSKSKMTEEYIAHASELAGRANIPEYFKPGLKAYENYMEKINKIQNSIERTIPDNVGTATQHMRDGLREIKDIPKAIHIANTPQSNIINYNRSLKRRTDINIKHYEAQVRAATNGLNSGKRHIDKTGGLIL